MANFKKDTHITFDGYNFNPEIAWPKISIKPNYFVSYLSYTKRSNCREGAYVNNSDGSHTRILCSVCNTILTSQEVTDKKTKCNSCSNLDNNKQSGILSQASRNRLQLAFDWLYLLSLKKKAYNEKTKSWYQFKIAMLTVKFPCEELHDDLFIKKYILNNFLTQLRTKYNLNMYLWRAERGDDSILHFHIIHDKFIDHVSINQIWNKILTTHGYIEQYRKNQQKWHKDGFKFRPEYACSKNPYSGKTQRPWTYQEQLKAYKKGIATNWSCPSGTTDIHSLRSIRNTKAYLAKYISKPADIKKTAKNYIKKELKKGTLTFNNRLEQIAKFRHILQKFKIEGNLWYISQPLSHLKGFLIEVDQTISDFCHKIFSESPSQFFQSDYCRIFKLGIKEIISKKFTPLIDFIRTQILEVRSKYYDIGSRLFSTLGIPLQLNF